MNSDLHPTVSNLMHWNPSNKWSVFGKKALVSMSNHGIKMFEPYVLLTGFLKWGSPQIINFRTFFHYKPSILGYPIHGTPLSPPLLVGIVHLGIHRALFGIQKDAPVRLASAGYRAIIRVFVVPTVRGMNIVQTDYKWLVRNNNAYVYTCYSYYIYICI